MLANYIRVSVLRLHSFNNGISRLEGESCFSLPYEKWLPACWGVLAGISTINISLVIYFKFVRTKNDKLPKQFITYEAQTYCYAKCSYIWYFIKSAKLFM